MMGHRCPAPWPAGEAPTPELVLQVLDSATSTWCDACRLRYVAVLTDLAGVGSLCVQRAHEDYPQRVEVLERLLVTHLGREQRYRRAWLSASRGRRIERLRRKVTT